MIRKIILTAIIFSSQLLYSLQITEIFYKGNPFLRSEERYIEIYNESSIAADLSKLTLAVPRNDFETTNLSVVQGNFQIRIPGIITNSIILPAGGFAVILTEEYNKFARIHSFASNTLILKPKNQAFTGWSWSNRLSMIKLFWNGTIIFSCADYSIPADNVLNEGESISLCGTKYERTSPTPGFHNSNYLWSDKQIIYSGETARISCYFKDLTNDTIRLNILTLPSLNSSTFYLSGNGKGEYKGILSPAALSHGDDLLISDNSNCVLIRFLDKRALSAYYHNILINELVSDPRQDYSGGGWSGKPGGGTIDSTDEWIELANLSDSTISLSNFYFVYSSKDTAAIKAISFRTNSGSGSKSGVISNHSYLVISPENGIANDAYIALYDGYPYRDGRIVDELEYGDNDIQGDGNWNNAPAADSSSIQDESISRFPNAVFLDNDYQIFHKKNASFGTSNGSEFGSLWAMNKKGEGSNPVYLIDTNNQSKTAEITVRNSIDSEKILLTNYGLYFSGTVSLTEAIGKENDGLLQVKNGIRNSIIYQDENPDHTVSISFLWAKNGWNLPEESPDLENVLLYPNPIRQNESVKIIFANLPDECEITFIDSWGNILKALKKTERGGFLEWETSLQKGIYIAVFKAKGQVKSKKLLVQ